MKFKNEFWAFIPARSGSKSIKDKNDNLFFVKKEDFIPLYKDRNDKINKIIKC